MRASLLADTGEISFAEADYLIGNPNAAAHALVLDPSAWASHALRLSGPKGSGKSHLAAIFAARGLGEVQDEEIVDEERWFHRLNAPSVPLLVVMPYGWRPALPDLASRLGALPETRLSEPDEALTEAVLTKLFSDRQLRVSAGLPRYLARRGGRSFESLRQIVARLDAEALRRGVAPNVRLARELLERPEDASL